MSLISSAIRIGERTPFPDPVVRIGIELLVRRTSRSLATALDNGECEFAREMAARYEKRKR